MIHIRFDNHFPGAGFHNFYMINYVQITEYRLIKVKYESMVDWHIKTDYLRCNPDFNRRPRYDSVVVKFGESCTFARLVFVFVCQVNGRTYQLALIQMLDRSSRVATKPVDKKLSISRWHVRARNRCEVIPVSCIVRGAVFVPDVKYKGDYLLLDTLDEDMFLRAKIILSSHK
jgi:hypothetical protein